MKELAAFLKSCRRVAVCLFATATIAGAPSIAIAGGGETPPLPIQITGPTSIKSGEVATYKIHVPNKSSAGYWDVSIDVAPMPGLTFLSSPNKECTPRGDGGVRCFIKDIHDWQVFDFFLNYFVSPSAAPCGGSVKASAVMNVGKPAQTAFSEFTTGIVCPVGCSDGVDNDGDGRIDLNDPGCSGSTDTDEREGCVDGIDNDGDGKVDGFDPGCTSTSDNDETDPKAACADGFDNDGDGRIDFADPGCTSPTDNDETNLPACQDGIDNDGDGKIDLADQGCSSPTDTDESGEILPECADGRDNDGDGWIDLADVGCANASDNSEKDPNGPACDNGKDDDGDGKIDFPRDPDCASPSGSEGGAPRGCSDGIDNDNDGAKDFPADFSCSSADDADEFNPKSQCQDGIDNDSDGWLDVEDSDCANAQDNVESPAGGGSGGTPGGGTPSAATLEPIVECVTNNGDGSHTAFFGYQNYTASQISAPAGTNAGGTVNIFEPSPTTRGQVGVFKTGRNEGAFAVTFTEAQLTWTLGTTVGSTRSATVRPGVTKACVALKAVLDCVSEENGGGLTAHFGYQNGNDFELTVPVGGQNSFTPAPLDRGQPNRFFEGNVSKAFSVGFDGGSLVWKLGSSTATATSSSARCSGTTSVSSSLPAPSSGGSNVCEEEDITDIIDDLDYLALRQLQNVESAISRLTRVDSSAGTTTLVRQSRTEAQTLADRNGDLAASLPEIALTCSSGSCAIVDQQPLITEYRANAASLRELTKKLLRQVEQTQGSLKTADKRVGTHADRFVSDIDEVLAEVPRFVNECN